MTITTAELQDQRHLLGRTILLMGKSLIEAGSELKRAEDTMNRLLQNSPFLAATEKEEMAVYVTINAIFLREKTATVDFVSIGPRDFDLTKISRLNQLSRAYSNQTLTVEELYDKTQAVVAASPQDQGAWWAYCLLSSSITLILGGSLLACVVAAFIGLVMRQAFFSLKKIISNVFLLEVCATFVAGLLAAIFCNVTQQDPTLLYIAAIIPRVPGINLTNGVHDTFDKYYISGPVMILESLTSLVSLSLGIVFLQFLPFAPVASGQIIFTSVPLLWQIVGSAFCSIAFAVIIHAPKHLFAAIGLAGVVTWCSYVAISGAVAGNLLNNLLSISLLSIVSQLLARRCKEPMTMFFIPALVAVVPGITLFVGLNQWFTGTMTAASLTFSNVLLSLLALAMGSLLGDELYAIFFKRLWLKKKT